MEKFINYRITMFTEDGDIVGVENYKSEAELKYAVENAKKADLKYTLTGFDGTNITVIESTTK